VLVKHHTTDRFPDAFPLRTRAQVVMPLSSPIKGLDGRDMSEIVVPNNTNVIVSIINANRDPGLWGPDSYEWKPERWLGAPPESVVNAHMPGVYSHLYVAIAEVGFHSADHCGTV